MRSALAAAAVLCGAAGEATAAGPYEAVDPALGDLAQGAARTVTVTVKNKTALARQITGVTASDGAFSVRLAGGAATVGVAQGSSFGVEITFSPTAAGSAVAQISVLDAEGAHRVFEASGRGTDVQIAVSARQLSFGDVFRFPRVPPAAEVQLSNVGTLDAPLPLATTTSMGFGVLSAPPPGPLAPGQSVMYRVLFEPQTIGAYAAALELEALGQVALSGHAVLRPVDAAAEAIDFGAAWIGEPERRTIALHNSSDAEITATTRSPNPRFRVVSEARAIPPRGSLAIEVAYTPGDSGRDEGQLSIVLDDEPQPQLQIGMRGAGVRPPGDGACAASGGGAGGALAALALSSVIGRRRRRRRR